MKWNDEMITLLLYTGGTKKHGLNFETVVHRGKELSCPATTVKPSTQMFWTPEIQQKIISETTKNIILQTKFVHHGILYPHSERTWNNFWGHHHSSLMSISTARDRADRKELGTGCKCVQSAVVLHTKYAYTILVEWKQFLCISLLWRMQDWSKRGRPCWLCALCLKSLQPLQ